MNPVQLCGNHLTFYIAGQSKTIVMSGMHYRRPVSNPYRVPQRQVSGQWEVRPLSSLPSSRSVSDSTGVMHSTLSTCEVCGEHGCMTHGFQVRLDAQSRPSTSRSVSYNPEHTYRYLSKCIVCKQPSCVTNARPDMHNTQPRLLTWREMSEHTEAMHNSCTSASPPCRDPWCRIHGSDDARYRAVVGPCGLPRHLCGDPRCPTHVPVETPNDTGTQREADPDSDSDSDSSGSSGTIRARSVSPQTAHSGQEDEDMIFTEDESIRLDNLLDRVRKEQREAGFGDAYDYLMEDE